AETAIIHGAPWLAELELAGNGEEGRRCAACRTRSGLPCAGDQILDQRQDAFDDKTDTLTRWVHTILEHRLRGDGNALEEIGIEQRTIFFGDLGIDRNEGFVIGMAEVARWPHPGNQNGNF